MIAALFVETNGVYFGLPDVEPWDIKRDARNYAGPWPVVAHPPCERWSMLSSMARTRATDDAGLFATALAMVRKYGGVLEHPAESYAWRHFDLAHPICGCWQQSILGGEWVTEVYQRHYGHRAAKKTWLVYVGTAPPLPLDWSMASSAMPVEHMDKKERRRTPKPFRDLLLTIAQTSVVH